jgi:hypothetical protein
MSRFPSTPEAITPDWLGAALAVRFPGVRVATIRVAARSDGTNQNARLRVEYEHRAGAPSSFFGKFPPSRERQRELVRRSGMGRREVAFYARLAPDAPMRVPACFVATHDPESGAFVLLLEDLEATGCRFPDAERGVSLAFAERAMDAYAALHARFATPAARAHFPIEPMPRMYEYGVGMLQHALATRRDALATGFATLAELYVDATAAIHDAWEAGPQSLIHGDGHATNLFEDAGRPGFFDWGLFACGPALRDVSYFLCMSLDVERRRAHERRLLERYLAARAQAGDSPPGIDAAWAAHRLHASYTVPAAAPAAIQPPGDGLQQRYARVFVERASAAVDDLDAVGALRAAIGR